jgi:hypothetical protein
MVRHGLTVFLLLAVLGACAPVPLAHDCRGWTGLVGDARLQTVQAFIPPELVATARTRQHLPPGTPDAEVFAAVAGSFDKVCMIEQRPELRLTEIVANLYG